MKLEIVGITTTEKETIEKTSREMLDFQGGYSANICYTKKDWNEIIAEKKENTQNRILHVNF